VAARVEKVLDERLGPSRYVAQMVGSDLYFAPGVAARVDADPKLWRDVQRAALGERGVQRVVWRTKPAADNLTRAVAAGLFPERSGDVWIGLKPNWIFSARTAAGWAGGTTHGSLHDYDQRVPIVLFGAGIKPGRYTASATPADIAPTLAFLSGTRIAKTDGRILKEALGASPPKPVRVIN
jgi:hypothetical protein